MDCFVNNGIGTRQPHANVDIISQFWYKILHNIQKINIFKINNNKINLVAGVRSKTCYANISA